jgi:hypothetical protein
MILTQRGSQGVPNQLPPFNSTERAYASIICPKSPLTIIEDDGYPPAFCWHFREVSQSLMLHDLMQTELLSLITHQMEDNIRNTLPKKREQ